MLLQAVVFAVVSALAAPVTLRADDSAASIAAGGLMPRRETRIVMAKEVLRISDKKVIVDYDFRNDTDQDVTTEVAFPVPPYQNFWQQLSLATESFSDFQLQIDGKPVSFQVEASATLNEKDVTAILGADKIDIASFGHFEELPTGDIRTADLERLPKSEQERLTALGLFGTDPPIAKWTVHLQYHWTQTFPAHSTVHIRHEYTPAGGYTQMPSSLKFFKAALLPANQRKDDPLLKGSLDLLDSFCADASFVNGMMNAEMADTSQEKMIYPHWVDFILTSANTWQRPIEDFTLILERPTTAGRRTLISFCAPQNGKVEKPDADHFQVHLANFVPAAELHIGFFDLPEAKAAQPAAKK